MSNQEPDEIIKGDLDLIGPDGKPYLTLTGVNEYHIYDVSVEDNTDD